MKIKLLPQQKWFPRRYRTGVGTTFAKFSDRFLKKISGIVIQTPEIKLIY